MQKVTGTISIVRVNLIETFLRNGQASDHIRPNGRKFSQDALDIHASAGSVVGGVLHCQKYPLETPNVRGSISAAACEGLNSLRTKEPQHVSRIPWQAAATSAKGRRVGNRSSNDPSEFDGLLKLDPTEPT